MANSFLLQPPLQSIFWAKSPTLPKQILLILSGVMLLAVTSQLSVPLSPVPLTFQSATVILIGMAYGARMGGYVILAYWVAGVVGLPVYANFSYGFAEFIGPTSGYLIGFFPAAYLSGYLAQRGFANRMLTSFISACLGTSLIFALGALVLAQWVGWKNAITLGVLPFLVSEPIKLMAVSVLIPKLWKNK